MHAQELRKQTYNFFMLKLLFHIDFTTGGRFIIISEEKNDFLVAYSKIQEEHAKTTDKPFKCA